VSSLAGLLDEIVDTLTDTVSTDGFPVQVTRGYNFNPTPPALDVYPGEPFGDITGAGFGDLEGRLFVTVRARVQTADTTAGQELLLAFMDVEDDLSVTAALMADQTLNGHVHSVLVGSPTGFRQYLDSGSEGSLLGCEWPVTLLRAYS
jgi:hypothetical protein